MKPPDVAGRSALFEHYLRGLKLAARLSPQRLAPTLAAAAAGLTGADIAFVCRRAALICVEQATRGGTAPPDLAIDAEHLRTALADFLGPLHATAIEDPGAPVHLRDRRHQVGSGNT